CCRHSLRLCQEFFADRRADHTDFGSIERTGCRFECKEHTLRKWTNSFVCKPWICVGLENDTRNSTQGRRHYHHRTGVATNPDYETYVALPKNPPALPETGRHGAKPLEHVQQTPAHHWFRIDQRQLESLVCQHFGFEAARRSHEKQLGQMIAAKKFARQCHGRI